MKKLNTVSEFYTYEEAIEIFPEVKEIFPVKDSCDLDRYVRLKKKANAMRHAADLLENELKKLANKYT